VRAPQPSVYPASSSHLEPPPQACLPSGQPSAWHGHLPDIAEAETTAFATVANAARPQAVHGSRIADDLFFVALDDRTGLLRVHGDVVGSVLAGALLAELAVGEWIEVIGDLVKPSGEALRQRTVPGDALAHKVLDTVLGQRDPLPSREWIAFLAAMAEREVADRLARANLIAVQRRRRGLSKGFVYRPAEANLAAWPRARLSEHCRARRELDSHDIVLAGLCHASGLLHHVLDAAPPGTYEQAMQQVCTRLAESASVVALLDAVESTVTADAFKLA
ncbi:GPP34 family phosphoprotein, partial [Actinoplanes sp. NPDC049668]|uniref:GOLPH3/VPS74 family protein n=1 Tax=unclassified Actinoplanes TaxID=2626549 RepID=UPI0033A061C6